jgi:hypothetical protein
VELSGTTVWGLKQTIENTLGIPAFEQRLLVNLRELCPDHAPCPAALGDATCIHLVRRRPSQAALLQRLVCDEWVWELANEPEEVRSDRELGVALVDQDGNYLEHLTSELRRDPEVVQRAVRSTPAALAYASDDLRADRDFVIGLIQESLAEDDNFIERLLDDPLGIFRAAQELLRYAAPELQCDSEVLAAAGLGQVPTTSEHATDVLLFHGFPGPRWLQ